jgi:hypothetical protein
MDDLLTSNGHQDAFDDFSASIQPEFPPEMAGDGNGTVVWEDFDELNDPGPADPDDDCWMSVDQQKNHFQIQMTGKIIHRMSNANLLSLLTKHVDSSGSKPRKKSTCSA